MAKKWDVYVYGDVNIDLIIPGIDGIPPGGEEWDVPVMETAIGGGAALFALGLGKLGMHPVFQGAVGDDCYSRFILEAFQAYHIDTSLITRKKDRRTGISLSFTNEEERSFITYRGTNETIQISNIKIEEVSKAGHIHVTGYCGSKNHSQYLTFLKQVKSETDATVSFDLGWDDTGEWNQGITELFSFIDVLFMNETESVHYSRKATAQEAAVEFARDCNNVVIKLGEKGAVAVSGGQVYKKEGFSVKVADTTGAGDSFNAGFVYGFLSGMSMEECLVYANGCGGLSCTGYGGNTAFPTRGELYTLIKKGLVNI